MPQDQLVAMDLDDALLARWKNATPPEGITVEEILDSPAEEREKFYDYPVKVRRLSGARDGVVVVEIGEGDEMVRRFRRVRPSGLEFIHSLRQQHVRVIALTNGDTGIQKLLVREVGLESLFEGVYRAHLPLYFAHDAAGDERRGIVIPDKYVLVDELPRTHYNTHCKLNWLGVEDPDALESERFFVQCTEYKFGREEQQPMTELLPEVLSKLGL